MMKSSKPLPPKKTINHIIGSGSRSSSSSSGNQNRSSSSSSSSNNNNNNNNNNSTTSNNQQQQQQPKESGSVGNNVPVKSEPNPICDICAQNVPGPERENIFAFGKCDHHVCYVCSARLRAICDQLECPICRDKLDCVIFSANNKGKSYEKHDIKSYKYNEKYKIYFENDAIKKAFEKLLTFECLECLKGDRSSSSSSSSSKQTKKTPPSDPDPSSIIFPDVLKLKNHLDFRHELRLCDLCLKHNKLFPFEFSYYDTASLSKHMRKGEPNTSHRGHPICSLCKKAFFNQEDLVLHMSREHFHCHLCQRHHSNMQVYFSDYPSLRDHFRYSHFLCERENCRHEHMTSAFDSRIDYQLHVAEVHGGSANLSRGEARQQRTITLDSAPHRAPPADRHLTSLPPNAAIVSTGTPATANNTDPRRQIPESIQQQIRQQRLPSRSEFPALGNVATTSNSPLGSQGSTVSPGPSTNQFPSLAQVNPSQQSRSVSLYQRIVAGASGSRGSFVRSAGGGNRRPEQLDEIDFPPLPEQPKSKSNKTKAKKSIATSRDESLTLDQLINSSLTLSSRSNNRNRQQQKPSKSAKPKALKIQL